MCEPVAETPETYGHNVGRIEALQEVKEWVEQNQSNLDCIPIIETRALQAKLDEMIKEA